METEGVGEGGDEFGGLIADARLAGVAEVGEVVANLGVVDAEHFAELAGGDDGKAFMVPAFEMAQVEAETLDAGARELRFAADGTGRSVVLAHARILCSSS